VSTKVRQAILSCWSWSEPVVGWSQRGTLLSGFIIYHTLLSSSLVLVHKVGASEWRGLSLFHNLPLLTNALLIWSLGWLFYYINLSRGNEMDEQGIFD
jgi:hypothetical protein